MTVKFYNKNFYSSSSSSSSAAPQQIIEKLENLNNRLSKNQITDIKRDLIFFGDNLSYISGKALNIKFNNKNLSISNIDSNIDKDIEKFIKIFNDGLKSNNTASQAYLLNNNSKFYLVNYRNRKFIIVLDIIDNIGNKKCFNIDGKLITVVKDSLIHDGGLHREGGNYVITYKDGDIIPTERKVKSTERKVKSTERKVKSTPLIKVKRNNSKISKSPRSVQNEITENMITRLPKDKKLRKVVPTSNPTKDVKPLTINNFPKILKIRKTFSNIKETPKIILLKTKSLLYNIWLIKPIKSISNLFNLWLIKLFNTWLIKQFNTWLIKPIKAWLIKPLLNLSNTIRSNILSFLQKPLNYFSSKYQFWNLKNKMDLFSIPFLIIAGFLEAAVLGWFINNPENWTVPEILPQSISELLPNVRIPEISPEAFPIVTEIQHEVLPENIEQIQETNGSSWKTIVVLGLIFAVLMYAVVNHNAVIKHNSTAEISEVINPSNRSSVIDGILDTQGNTTSLTISTLEKVLEEQGHYFVGGMPLSDSEALFKTLKCPNPNEELLTNTISLLGNINRNMSQIISDTTQNQLPTVSQKFEIPLNTAAELMTFVAANKETFTNILGDAAAFTPMIS